MPRGRPPYPELLTPREQEVLELIAEGLTNEQIAVRLGISFGGAKYHVAEILSKLGVSSREEAARYLRQPARTRFAALAPLMFWMREGATEPSGLVKAAILAAGGVAVLLVISALLVLPSIGGGDNSSVARDPLEAISADLGFDAQGNLVQRGQASNLTSYYYQASVEIGEKPPPPGGRRPPAAELPELRPTQIRSWYSAGEGSRWDALDGNTLVGRRVFDQDSFWSYDGSTNTYEQYALDDNYRSGVEVGPLPADGIVGLHNPQDWKPAGQERIAGRITQIVEREVDGQYERIWVDTEYNFVLKHESNDGMNPHRVTEVTRIDYNGSVSPQQLVFDTPPAARELPAVTGPIDQNGFNLGPFGGPPGSGGHAVSPEGMLSLTYAPDGHGAQGGGGRTKPISATESMTLGYVVWYGLEHNSPASFVVTQQYRAGGMTQDMRVGDAVAVRGSTGYRQSVPGEERLVFEAGDIIVTITSDVLPLEELVKIAEGME